MIEKYIHCPNCKAPLSLSDNGKSLLCDGERVHCFDIAKSGYVNLVPAHAGGGDSKDAVHARTAFLEKGYYSKISDTLNELISLYPHSLVVDAGCGEGYYTERAARAAQNGAFIGFDLSKYAIEAASRSARAKQTENVSYGVSGIYDMPLPDGSVDVVLNIFAPCAEQEFSRVLRPGGILILTGAGERHLFGLKSAVYESPYLNPGREDLPSSLEQLEHKELCYNVEISPNSSIKDLFSMTPYYFRTSESDRQKLDSLETLTTEIHTDFYIYRKK